MMCVGTSLIATSTVLSPILLLSENTFSYATADSFFLVALSSLPLDVYGFLSYTYLYTTTDNTNSDTSCVR